MHDPTAGRLFSTRLQPPRFVIAFVLTISLALFPTARAANRVTEIHQSCAVQMGCFSGDTAGDPVTIDGPANGSDRLMGNLIVPDENRDGMVVNMLGNSCNGRTTCP